MSRLLRRRLSPPKLDSEEKTVNRKPDTALPTASKKNLRVITSERPTKNRTTRASRKVLEQNENITPQSKKSQAKEKLSNNTFFSSLNSQPLKRDVKNKKPVLLAKSPVFRDRTNECVDPAKIESSLNLVGPLTKQKSAIRKLKTEDVSSEKELISKAKEGIKNVVNLPEIKSSKGKRSLESKKLSQNKSAQKETRVSRTRSGKFSVEKNSTSDPAEKNEKDNPVVRNKKSVLVENNKKDDQMEENKKGNLVENNKEDDSVEKNKKDEPLPKMKKFFTSKQSDKVEIAKSIKDRGRKRKFVKKQVLDDSSFNMPEISEEMSPREKKTLRPRQDLKNYCEESKLVLSPKSRNSKVVLDKIPNLTGKKLPIWKTIQFHETKNNNKDVYDISDSDFSFEERPKKRKRVIKKPIKRLKKANKFAKTVKKKPLKSANIQQTSDQVPERENVHKLVSQVHPKPKLISPVQLNPNLPSQVPLNSDLASQVQSNRELVSQVHQKPKLISVKVLNNKNKVSFVPTPPMAEAPKEFRPFRVTQNFRPRSTLNQNMSDHSLLSKTMSPIAKITENADFSTPWRIPPVQNFSRVRNLVQSTPQSKTSTGLLSRRNTVLDKPKISRTDEEKLESVVELGNDPEMSDYLSQVKLKAVQMKSYEIPHVADSMETSVQNSFPDDVEDKENAAPNYQSPQKSPKKKSILGTPVFEPQPGPSGLQKQPLRELKALRQTNLNNFLNLDDTPEKTEIRTPHGIFDDVHSTPINGKLLKKTCQTDIQNAFGFSDDDYDYDYVDTSPIACENKKPMPIVLKGILREKKENGQTRQKSERRKPARLCAKEILRTLHERRVKKGEKDKQNKIEVNQEKEQREAKLLEEQVKGTEKEDQENEIIVTNLSDTFDLLEEQTSQNVENEKGHSPLPLFADLEPPTHFVAPPKSIYKRKREAKFSFSEESCDDENSNVVKEKMKKKSKKSKKEDKKLNDWARNINKTFEDIDNFDLIVE